MCGYQVEFEASTNLTVIVGGYSLPIVTKYCKKVLQTSAGNSTKT
jgi:hypothetical protein